MDFSTVQGVAKLVEMDPIQVRDAQAGDAMHYGVMHAALRVQLTERDLLRAVCAHNQIIVDDVAPDGPERSVVARGAQGDKTFITQEAEEAKVGSQAKEEK